MFDPPSQAFVLGSHELPLDEAPEAYKNFDARETGWTKVVLKPGMAESKKSKAASAGEIA